jgi:glutaconyl-CoA/methylmalonyl-CoA decarboxylase subunit gamma
MKKFNITVNGVVYQVEVEEIKDGAVAAAPKAAAVPAAVPAEKEGAPIVKPEAKPNFKSSAVPAGATKIEAPMPGNIWKVHVREGQEVKEGDVVIILEAMKMENEILAPKDGVVAAIHVGEGRAVNSGDVLISLA